MPTAVIFTETEPASFYHGPSALRQEESTVLDILVYGIAFVFLGGCLVYVRAADRL